jgi:glycosyltransferase involved in cell wall biosynthesis
MKVTTLIPVFNGAKYIRESVDSALAQREVEVELIVIDDGSTDETPQILESYGNSLRVLRQPNAGHVIARNNGAKLAGGQWLAFLDADDAWMPDKLARQLAAAGDDAGMVYTNRDNFGDIDRVGEGIDGRTLPEGDLFERLLFGNFITVSSVLFRRDWFERLGGFEASLRVCEDWDLWMRYCAEGGIIRVCPEPLTRYRWHGDSMSFDHHRMCDGRFQVLRRALAHPRASKVPAGEVKRAIAETWRCSAWHAQATRRWLALRWYVNAAWYAPSRADNYKQILKCCLGLA